MASDIESLSLDSKVSEWPRLFQEAELDWVPDPMVLRAAELFSAGQKICEECLKLEGSRVLPTIEQNIDGILAFFHALLIRAGLPAF